MREECELLSARLEQANRVAALGQVAATMAHEFNNVLMSIQPYTDLLQRPGARDPEVARKCAESIRKSIRRGQRTTEEILRYTRPSEPVLAPANVGELLTQFAAELTAANFPGITVELDAPSDDVFVVGDTRQIEQVLWNASINARDAMPEGGRIIVSGGECSSCSQICGLLSPDQLGSMACLKITDTGGGMDEATLAGAFQPLFTTKRNGTGLGLAVAQQIAARHGGHVFARSRVGEGTTIYLLLKKWCERGESNPQDLMVTGF